jgi:hypothetical protein
VSKARAKKKRRQRARGAAGAPAARPPAKDPRGGGGAKAPRGEAAGARAAGGGGAKAPRTAGVPRPGPVWAPFPLTEIGMAVGIVIFGAGLASNSFRLLSIGALMLAVVVGELCLREHFAGFRSHTLLLAALPVAVAHGVVVLAITDAYRGPLTLAVDLAVGGALAWWLRARYRVAREQQV